jgi:DNA mismatch repair protein MutS
MSQLTFLEGGEHQASPIRRQYLDIKRRHPDAILLFRLGDFYETFDEDARIVAAELEIALTGREMGRGERVPLAGIPYHAAEGHIARLIAKGHRVAVCEQMGTTPVKGLVPREVVRVITPGTLVEDAFLPRDANNFLAALYLSPDGAGMAIADISTGEYAVTEMRGENWEEQLAAELERVRPAECLIPASQKADSPAWHALLEGRYLTGREDGAFSLSACERILKQHFDVSTLDGFGLTSSPLSIRAAGSLLGYLQETQPASVRHLESIRAYSVDGYMKLDAATRRNLELTPDAGGGAAGISLLSVLDRTRTAMGTRLLLKWIGQPLLDVADIQSRLDRVEEMLRSPLGRAQASDLLSAVADLERLASRASIQSLNPRDCLSMARSLRIIPRLRALLQNRLPLSYEHEADQLDSCEAVADAIERTLADDPPATVGEGMIRSGRSGELDELRGITGDTRRWITRLEQAERERTGIRTLKIGYNKVFGYYIEVTRPNLETATDEYARTKTGASTVAEMLEAMGYQRKQTLAGAERFVTQELKEHELRLQSAQDEIEALEKQIYAELLAELATASHRIRTTGQSVARLDVFLSLAEVAGSNRYTRPVVDLEGRVEIRAGRHPLVERALPAGVFVANDCSLSSDGAQIAILTGPNMAGKSTYILGVALIVVMAQMGSFVPADDATIGLVDRVFTRVGAQHDITGGRSTFLVEMAETANILRNATRRSLVILDEVGRGTSTYDGMAIARAVVESLHDQPHLRCRTLFATHYHEMTELESVLPRVRNLRMDVLEEGDRVVFLHQVVPGGADRSYGIHVAQLAGVPTPVIVRAREILRLLEARAQSLPLPATTGDPVQPPGLSPVEQEILRLDLESMTPLQALARLHELQQRASKDAG